MSETDLNAMAFEDLWLLHEEITKVLSQKIMAEKLELEKRFAQLNPPQPTAVSAGLKPLREQTRRHYPKVLQKYCNPMEPGQTWSGRGKKPRWLLAALEGGHKLEEFEICEHKTET
jgi:DNA-binding protein H-NS